METTQVDSLTIRVTGSLHDNVPLESLAVLIQNAFKLLLSLDPQRTLVWRVKESTSRSPLTIVAVADATTQDWDRGVVDSFLDTVCAVSEPKRLPQRATPRSLGHARKIVSILSDHVSGLELHSPGRESVVPIALPRSRIKSEPKRQRWDYEDYGELDGTLEVASTHNGFKVSLFDTLNGRKTECIVTRDTLNDALEAMKQEDRPRVALAGRIRYDIEGYPVEMIVDDLERMPSVGSDPSLVQGINLTDGMDSVAYVRGMRDDD